MRLICLFLGHIWGPMYGMRYDGQPLGPVIGIRCKRCWSERLQSRDGATHE